jgi:ABC-2 type transport system ATP-binding protein
MSEQPSSRKVVDGLDLPVPRGAVYGLLGRNGAGKSTTLKMLAGLVHPDSGTAELLGEDVTTLSPATRARIAYLAEGGVGPAGKLLPGQRHLMANLVCRDLEELS